MRRGFAVIFATLLTIFVLALIAGAGANGPTRVWSSNSFFGAPCGNIVAQRPWPPPDGGGNIIIAQRPWPPPDGGGNIRVV